MSFGCSNQEMINSKEFDDSYIEIIPPNASYFISNLSDNKVLLNYDEIKEYNNVIESKTDKLYNLDIDSITKEKLVDLINSYDIPLLPKYNNGVSINTSNINDILENRNLENIFDIKLKKGIVINRTNLKSFPTDIHFFSDINDTNFDSIQETEIKINTPVIVLHESKDKKWLFVLTKTYYGWIKKEDVALSSDKDYEYFTNNDNFVVITEPFIEIENKILDMGVKLPFINSSEDGYLVSLPINENGNLKRKDITISRDKAHINYLDYTKKNVLIEAFKYEGVPYSWGGMDYGVDCSSYVSNVYSVFGFQFPRNTSSQNDSVGKIIDLSNKENDEKLKIIENSEPSLLYMEGHVLIYIGIKDNNHYVINASGNKNILRVEKEKLDDSIYLSKLKKLVLIEKN